MMQRAMRSYALVLGVLLLAACAGQRIKPTAADATTLAAQSAREAALSAKHAWTLHGRLGVSDGHDSGSGSLEWSQQDSGFRFSVHAPVTGKTWVLSGDAGHASLEGLRERAVEGNDAADLLARELGWQVPVAELTYWARGMRAPGDARIEFRADGLPAQIDQRGWTVRYLDYDTSREPALPSKVFASKADYKVRLSIRDWTLE
jgi:outer membrane lipoprotein LolB